ncbi:MAG: Flp pilus assembly protein CpaB [Candidatus Omnitrophica bacterium]|jgi:pilus assembly protein CpaB|nr:Flp pilus assembly protein CpaB [Candidatus Omnitrophota bacterium]MDD5660746.1 Flp pilus assembly protein CpaB [Candidatus Omnitrophota bacterium]
MVIDKQKLILGAGIFLAIMAAIMLQMFIKQQQQLANEKARAAIANLQSNQTAVLVAKQDIPQGLLIEPEMFETSIVPNKFVQPQAVTSLDRIAGMITVAPIAKGEQISLSKLVSDQRAAGGNLAGVTPSGKRAITIIADSIASLSGMVRPGDYVDVLAIIQVPAQNQDGKLINQTAVVPLFQNVLVLAVGQNTGALAGVSGRYSEPSPSSNNENNLITLALGPNESNLIAFVQEQGRMRLVMRSPADAKVEPMAPVSWDNLFQYIMPQKDDVGPDVTPVDTTEYVEVLRGLNKAKVPLSK